MKNPLFTRHLGGSGTPLLFLHGFLGSGQNFGSVGRDLGDSYQVHSLDLRNHGKSPHDPEHTYDAMVEDVCSFIRDSGFENCVLVGHSMGGKVAMQLACRYPRLVSKLVVVDILPINYKHEHDELKIIKDFDCSSVTSRDGANERLKNQGVSLDVRNFILSNLKREPDGSYCWRINLPVLEKSFDHLRKNNLSDDDRFSGPVLLLRADRSDYIESEALAESVMNRYFPDSRLVTINNSGHNPHIDQREKFVSYLRDFIGPST